jgi:hypothetical protein
VIVWDWDMTQQKKRNGNRLAAGPNFQGKTRPAIRQVTGHPPGPLCPHTPPEEKHAE